MIHKFLLWYYESRSKIAQYDNVVNVVRKRKFPANILVKIVGLPILHEIKNYRKYILKLDKRLQKYDYDNSKKCVILQVDLGLKKHLTMRIKGRGVI